MRLGLVHHLGSKRCRLSSRLVAIVYNEGAGSSVWSSLVNMPKPFIALRNTRKGGHAKRYEEDELSGI
jgi:hypothetical protein